MQVGEKPRVASREFRAGGIRFFGPLRTARRSPFVAALICGYLLLSAGAALAQSPTVTEDPLERQMLEIAKDLRCAVCQNQPVSESNADLARDMRRIIREQLEAGKSREEIIQYFVDRYGNYMLLKPPVRGAGMPVWAAPVVLAAIIGVTGFLYLRRRLGAKLPPPPALTEQDLARVRALRREEES